MEKSGTLEQEQIKAFYDDFKPRLLNDFICGNLRVRRAINFAVRNIPLTAERILDIGCGIGWSSYELARHFPSSHILGVDLSEQLITSATQLFPKSNLSFKAVDVTMTDFQARSPSQYDAIVLIDVFEHIQLDARLDFYQAINHQLAEEGYVLLAFPSPEHLSWYRKHQPEILQPVDNDVSLADLQAFAKAIDGNIVGFNYQTTWQSNDYVHAVLQKGQIPFCPEARISKHSQASLLSPLQRKRLAKRAFPEVRINLLKAVVKHHMSRFYHPWREGL